MRLLNKVALVTGGAGGIGTAIAGGMAKEGATVVITGRNEARLRSVAAFLTETTHRRVQYVVMDIMHPEQIEEALEQIWEMHGRVDVLVNNAGVLTRVPFLELTVEDWRKDIETNLTGTFFCSQIAAKKMVRDEIKGSIINITSILADAAGENMAAYIASKGGEKSLTKAMAVELAKHGIRVNGIAPNVILTNMTSDLYDNDAHRAYWIEKTPLGRVGVPEDLVGAAVLLASDESSYITGSTIYVDGGRLAK